MKLILEVPGMSCAHCEAAVKGELGRVTGVGNVDVDLTTKLVTVDGDQLDLADISAEIDEAGYEVVGHHEVR
jgi:copper chaperone